MDGFTLRVVHTDYMYFSYLFNLPSDGVLFTLISYWEGGGGGGKKTERDKLGLGDSHGKCSQISEFKV